MNRSLCEKEGNKKEKKYFRKREQHFYKHLCKGLVYPGNNRDIWLSKDIQCVSGEARDVTRQR